MREMKDSGVEWIGAVPSSWQTLTIGSLFKVRNEKVNDVDYPPLSVSKGGIVPQMENVAKSDASDNRKMVLANDFVINSRSDRKQSCGVSPLNGSVSLINIVLYPAKDAPIIPAYLNYLMKNHGFAEEYYRWGHGIVADLWTTRWQEMKSILLPIAPKVEQQRILDRISEKTEKVDVLISNVRTQIEKLKAYKQSLITEAVTKGLDPTVPMKDSGVAWIGDVPLNWNLTSIGRMCFVTKLAGFEYTSEMNGNITPIGDVPIVRAQNVKMGKFIEPVDNYISFEISKKLDRCALDKKSLLITFIGAGIGEVAIFDRDRRYHLAPNVAKIVIYDSMTSWIREEYLLYFIMSSSGQEEVNKIKKATAQPSLSMQTIRSIAIVIPPVEEQLQIADYLDKKCSQIDCLIAIKQVKIEKLEQYKQSLIYEYVTGKKEVL